MNTNGSATKSQIFFGAAILTLSFSFSGYWFYIKNRQGIKITHVQSKHEISTLRVEYQKTKIQLKNLYVARQNLVENALKKKKNQTAEMVDSNLKISLAQVNNFSLSNLEELERFDFVQNLLTQEIQRLMSDAEVGAAFVVKLVPLENQIFKARQEFFKIADSLNSIISNENIASERKVPVFLAESLLAAEETKKK